MFHLSGDDEEEDRQKEVNVFFNKEVFGPGVMAQ